MESIDNQIEQIRTELDALAGGSPQLRASIDNLVKDQAQEKSMLFDESVAYLMGEGLCKADAILRVSDTFIRTYVDKD